MTTRANKLLLLLAGLLLLGSCNKVTYVYADSYIMYYAIHDGIEIWTNKNKLGQHLLEVRLKKPFKSVSYDSKGEDKIIYDELCKKHNDLFYCREVPFFNGVGGAIASYPDYTSVSITSNSNYDEEHPAGTPLNDIIICEYCSSYLYVLGGYADESLLDVKTKPLLEVTDDDLALLGLLNFFFTQNPDTSGRHDITVSVTTDDGRTFTATCTMDFSE
ncbi:MAG TPA: hypothetical protein PLU97_03795 [Candidatus Cryptobacteroides sp.]|nr:hypothetical protein [Candidatus Cryptobacteroides sp.]